MSHIYLAGPIRGHDYETVKATFAQVARQLRQLRRAVLNPIEQDEMWDNDPGKENFSIRKALAIDTKWICEECDLLVCVPGWESSRGARMEHALYRVPLIRTRAPIDAIR